MREQCVPGPLLSFVGPGNEASYSLSHAMLQALYFSSVSKKATKSHSRKQEREINSTFSLSLVSRLSKLFGCITPF